MITFSRIAEEISRDNKSTDTASEGAGVSQRQRSLSDSQRDKAKLDNNSELIFTKPILVSYTNEDRSVDGIMIVMLSSECLH